MSLPLVTFWTELDCSVAQRQPPCPGRVPGALSTSPGRSDHRRGQGEQTCVRTMSLPLVTFWTELDCSVAQRQPPCPGRVPGALSTSPGRSDHRRGQGEQVERSWTLEFIQVCASNEETPVQVCLESDDSGDQHST
ncbi:hypothetical protein P4O66_004507 [Electrophorus voltai]|uniref:Uncharacterized protein n=1 Tax=Electrophorus voltai TaxID=2609070 RepID=A0AAD8YNP3_9TELE|nr:hypothetical protein P4O66_004507 [Electrophorus voltai]